jgi:hypothetical protein
MSVSFEKRHLPLPHLWFHKRLSGSGAAVAPVEDFLLLESDPGTATDKLLLESDPGTNTDALLLQSST